MNKTSQQANRERWMKHVSEWRQSGLTQLAYCRLHGLVSVTFNAWVGREKRTSVEPAAPLTLVPVVVQPAAVHGGLNSPISLQHHSGWQLHLPAGTKASRLGKVLKEIT